MNSSAVSRWVDSEFVIHLFLGWFKYFATCRYELKVQDSISNMNNIYLICIFLTILNTGVLAQTTPVYSDGNTTEVGDNTTPAPVLDGNSGHGNKPDERPSCMKTLYACIVKLKLMQVFDKLDNCLNDFGKCVCEKFNDTQYGSIDSGDSAESNPKPVGNGSVAPSDNRPDTVNPSRSKRSTGLSGSTGLMNVPSVSDIAAMFGISYGDVASAGGHKPPPPTRSASPVETGLSSNWSEEELGTHVGVHASLRKRRSVNDFRNPANVYRGHVIEEEFIEPEVTDDDLQEMNQIGIDIQNGH